MPNSLLAHIASNFISQYENVANSSVCYLLNECEVVRKVLQSILDIETPPLHYETEESTAFHGRPDVTGKDDNGNTAVIIEGKFWAAMTENQPNGYLLELTDTGKLLFLVPDKRKTSIELELKNRLGGENDKVLVRSWHKFLELIEVENNKNHNSRLASDLNQLKALCQKMDVEGMPPLSASDLDPMNGRVSAQLADVIDECNLVLRNWEHANFSGLRKTGKKYGHGFYFSGYKFVCYLCVASDKWFMRDNHTPIWLSVLDYDSEKRQYINRALHSFDSDNSWDDELGIMLQPGLDKNQVVEHIVKRVKEAIEYCHDYLPPRNKT